MPGSASLHHLLNPEPNSTRQHPPPPPTTTATSHRNDSSHLRPQRRQPSPSVPDSEDAEFDDFFTLLDDSEEEEESSAANMPASTRNNTRRHSVVDLTDTPNAQSSSRRRKRSAEGEVPARKRGRVTKEEVEEIDLADENPSAEEELRQAQQKATIRAQQAEIDAGPQKLGKMQCIICMESYTDATATACGHFYCHECLHQSLLVGERGDERKGTCPVCRKTISRKKKNDIIPMSFMRKSTFLEHKKARA